MIALTDIKGHAMVQFSFMMLKLFKGRNFTLESELAERNFENNTRDKVTSVKKILSKMSHNFWKCDPQEHVEGRTYVKLTNFLQVKLSIASTNHNISISFFLNGLTVGRCFRARV
jgi:hypothetical protein